MFPPFFLKSTLQDVWSNALVKVRSVSVNHLSEQHLRCWAKNKKEPFGCQTAAYSHSIYVLHSLQKFFWNNEACRRPKYYEQSIIRIQEQMESCDRKYNCNIHAIYISNYVELNIIEILKINYSVCKWRFRKLHPLNL